MFYFGRRDEIKNAVRTLNRSVIPAEEVSRQSDFNRREIANKSPANVSGPILNQRSHIPVSNILPVHAHPPPPERITWYLPRLVSRVRLTSPLRVTADGPNFLKKIVSAAILSVFDFRVAQHSSWVHNTT